MAEAFYRWLKIFLTDRGLRLSKAGFKGGADLGKHNVSAATGYWERPAYSGGKPLRWIFQVDYDNGNAHAATPTGQDEINIGGSNTNQGPVAGLAFRILPVLKVGDGQYERLDDFEINAVFVFRDAVGADSSSDAFSMNVETGELRRVGNPEHYIYAALIGLRPRTDTLDRVVEGNLRTISYGEIVDAVANAIHVAPVGVALGLMPAYDATDNASMDNLRANITNAWAAAPPPAAVAPPLVVAGADEAPNGEADEDEGAEPIDYTHVDIPTNPDLLGISAGVYRQINAMLKSGKQHLMLYGPPGTGKTSLARWIAENLPGEDWTLVTGSSDWSSQDIIGGYQPVGGGEVEFIPGILLRSFDHPLIIDELNRCDIDKVIGPLFTVLSGQQTTMPYRTDVSDPGSQPYVILPQPKPAPAAHEFAPGPAWRLIATINSIDKASLYQMSYALSRRFGWVYVDAPDDLAGFIRAYVTSAAVGDADPAAGAACPLALLWEAINQVRVIGPAPIIDAIKGMRAIDPAVSFFGPADAATRGAALDALDMVLLPMLDGIVQQDATSIADAVIAAFGLDEPEQRRIKTRLEAVAI